MLRINDENDINRALPGTAAAVINRHGGRYKKSEGFLPKFFLRVRCAAFAGKTGVRTFALPLIARTLHPIAR
jgi:hypothetical protein